MYDEFIETALAAARAGGCVLLNHFKRPRGVEAKGARDVVSDADRESESAILNVMSARYPDIGWVAEESGVRPGASPYRWYVDPLDGTSPFLMGVPYFSVAIALCHEREVLAGVVYNPLLDDSYTAERGLGAWLNGEAIRVSERDGLVSALGGCAFASNERAIRCGVVTMQKLSLAGRKTLVHYSPALDICNIARGRMDFYVDSGTTPEDHAAAGLILREAGGSVNTPGHEDWDFRETGILASNGGLHRALLKLLEFTD